MNRREVETIGSDCGGDLPVWADPQVWALMAGVGAVAAYLPDRALVVVVVVAAVSAGVGSAVSRVAYPMHGHCDRCDRCSTDAGVRTGWTVRAADARLKAAGWSVDRDRVGCPDHPVTGR